MSWCIIVINQYSILKNLEVNNYIIIGGRGNNTGGIDIWNKYFETFQKPILYINEYSSSTNRKISIFHYKKVFCILRTLKTKDAFYIVHKETYALIFLLLLLFKRRCLLVIHGFHYNNIKMNYILRHAISIIAIIISYITPKRIIVVSLYDFNLLNSISKQFNKVNVLENPVRFVNIPRANREKDYVYLSRISKEKMSIETFGMFEKNCKYLDVYGSLELTEEESNLLKIFFKKSTYVCYKGYISNEKVYSVLQQYKFFVSFSSRESMPFAVLEAASAGCNLVLSDIRPHRMLGFKATFCSLTSFNFIDTKYCYEDALYNCTMVKKKYNIESWHEGFQNIAIRKESRFAKNNA